MASFKHPNPPDKKLVASHFNRAAESYDRVTPIQAAMGRKLLELAAARLDADARAILELGCGTGILTALLRRRFADARILAQDIAPAMVAVARARLPEDPALETVVGDAETVPSRARANAPFDLIIANAVVQWFATPLATVEAYRHLLRPGGILAIATFGPDTFRELRHAFRQAETALNLPHTPRTLAFPDADQWRRALPQAAVSEHRHCARYPSVPEFLRTIRRTGATVAARSHPPLTHALYRAMTDAYPRNDHPHAVAATYHQIFIILQTRPNT